MLTLWEIVAKRQRSFQATAFHVISMVSLRDLQPLSQV